MAYELCVLHRKTFRIQSNKKYALNPNLTGYCVWITNSDSGRQPYFNKLDFTIYVSKIKTSIYPNDSQFSMQHLLTSKCTLCSLMYNSIFMTLNF